MSVPQVADSAPLLDDQPAERDLLHYAQLAQALKSVILHPATRTPFIIGIFGRWGTGKTTLMRMLEKALDADQATSVWFSAWVYGQEQELWAAFLQSLTVRLTHKLRFGDKIRFAARIFRGGLSGTALLYQVPEYLWRAAIVALPLVAAAAFTAMHGDEEVKALVHSGGAFASILLAAWYFLRPAVAAIRREITPDFSVYQSVDFEKHIGFLERFRDQFARIVQSTGSGKRRVVIFVDDLDRCGPDKALELMDAIKIFLDVPGCIFVLGIDQSIIAQALMKKYPDDRVAQREYLSKIIQLPFHLPPLTEDDLMEYVRGLEVRFPDERCRAVFLSSVAPNPREIKRVINTFSLHWQLAQARAAGSSVTPVRLAKVVVIQQAFGSLFALLRDRPEWLGLLERSVLQRAEPTATINPVASAVETTVQLGPEGIALPPALEPFLEDVALTRLLSIYAIKSERDEESCFALLERSELVAYFTLTRRLGAVTAPPELAAAVPSAISGDPVQPDFGPRYRVIEKIGLGGWSEVYLAEDLTLHRKVAVKRLVSTLTNDPAWRARFEREIGVLRGIGAHPNLVNLVDSGMTAGPDGGAAAFYVMDWVAGETLQDLLARRHALEFEEARRLLAPIFDVLAHIHRAGIVHRDLKPSAIMISAGGVPRLLDFGLALSEGEGRDALTRVGTVLGTPTYMSPEQLLGKTVDARSDLYSMGVIMVESLTGEKPQGTDAVSIVQNLLQGEVPRPSVSRLWLPPEIDGFVARLLAREPEQRFASADEARQALLAVPGKRPSTVAPATTLPGR